MKKIYNELKLSNLLGMTTVIDRFFFIFLLVFSVAGFFFVDELFPSGSHVKVSLNNKTVYSLSLHENRIVAVRGPLGDSMIEIKDGRVHMKDSPCPRKLCIRQGWTDRGVITCLPNRVVVSIGSEEQHADNSVYDAVTK